LSFDHRVRTPLAQVSGAHLIMAMDYGLLAEDGAVRFKINKKMVGCIAGAFVVGVMLGGAAISGYSTSSPGVSEMVAVGASPFASRARLGAPRSTFPTGPVFSSPLAKLALTSIDINNRMNKGERDMSMKASQELGKAWDYVPPETQAKLEGALAPMKYKKNWLAGITSFPGYFDPIACSAGTSAGKLLFYREVELKHGRIAMLAALGIVVGENFHPLFGGAIDSPAIYAFQESPLETFWYIVVAALAIPEIYSVFTFQSPEQVGEAGTLKSLAVKGEQWTIKEDHFPGDLGFDPLGLKPEDEDELVEMQTKELNNGRLAMIATAGMIAQELVTGQKLTETWSQLR
jgi:hypothetical protein